MIHPGHVHALREELRPRFAELFGARLSGPREHERRELLAAWEEWRERAPGWLEAPETMQRGRELEDRFARLHGATAAIAVGDRQHFATGSKWLRVVTPSDVRDLKDEIDAAVRATEADVSASSSLDDATRSAWESWHASWEKFAAEKPGWFSTAAQMDHAEDLRDELHGWQEKLEHAGLHLSAPPITPADRPGLEPGLAKTGIVVAGLIAGALIIRSVAGK